MNHAVIYANGRYVLMMPFIALKQKWEIHYSGTIEDCIKFCEINNKNLQK